VLQAVNSLDQYHVDLSTYDVDPDHPGIVCFQEALDRIAADRVCFSRDGMRAQEVFTRIWNRIIHAPEELRGELVKRLAEEVTESSGTCTSGHIERLVNVLSGYDLGFDLRISWEDQVTANIKARLEARIKALPPDQQSNVLVALSNRGPPYMNWFDDEEPSLRRELVAEFVGEGHLEPGRIFAVLPSRS